MYNNLYYSHSHCIQKIDYGFDNDDNDEQIAAWLTDRHQEDFVQA